MAMLGFIKHFGLTTSFNVRYGSFQFGLCPSWCLIAVPELPNRLANSPAVAKSISLSSDFAFQCGLLAPVAPACLLRCATRLSAAVGDPASLIYIVGFYEQDDVSSCHMNLREIYVIRELHKKPT